MNNSRNTKIGSDMVWPSYDQGNLEWFLRYGDEKQIISSRMHLASIVAAYRALIELPQKKRNLICKSLIGATNDN